MGKSNGLSDGELAALSTLIYMQKYVEVEDGDTVATYMDKILDYMETEDVSAGGMDNKRWREFIANVKKKYPNLLSAQIVEPVKEFGTEFSAFTVISGNSVNIIYRGTAGPTGWADNAKSFYQEDSYHQRKALEYARDIMKQYSPSQYTYATAGHSKGGNLAMYVAIMLKDIDKCTGFDGQGVSYEFYQKIIEELGEEEFYRRMAKITNYAAASFKLMYDGIPVLGDIVNGLAYIIAGRRVYVDVGDKAMNPLEAHNPDYLANAIMEGAETTEEVPWLVRAVEQITQWASKAAETPFLGKLIEMGTDFVMTLAAIFTRGPENKIEFLIYLIDAIKSLALSNILEFLHKLPAFIAKCEEYIGKMTSAVKMVIEKIVSKGKEIATAIAVTIASLYHTAIEVAKHGIEVIGDAMQTAINYITNKAAELAAKAGTWIVNVKNKVVTALSTWKNAFTSFIKKKVQTGVQYAKDHPLIVVDTALLHQYASKLTTINNMLSQIDRDMNSLYTKVGAVDMWRLIHADLHTHYSAKLTRCRNYMENTADQFEQIESFLALFG